MNAMNGTLSTVRDQFDAHTYPPDPIETPFANDPVDLFARSAAAPARLGSFAIAAASSSNPNRE